MQPVPHRQRSRGFTLIELMVAIAAMALLALMSWRGIDGMTRAQTFNRDRGDAVLTLQTTLSQWSADLDASITLSQTHPIDWNGRMLRVTRTGTDGVLPVTLVVAWTSRTDANGVLRWYRWQSPAVHTRGEWQQAWNRAASWGEDGNNDARGAETALMPIETWQLAYFRNDVWSPAVDTETLGTATPMPDGVRLVLTLPPGGALSGQIVRDWVRPAASIAKS